MTTPIERGRAIANWWENDTSEVGTEAHAAKIAQAITEEVAAERERCAKIAQDVEASSDREESSYEIGRANAGAYIAAHIRKPHGGL